MNDLTWTIGLEGRRRTREELKAKGEALPSRIEVVEGRLLWSEEDRLILLAMLLKHCGARAAVRLGDPSIWREAAGELRSDVPGF